MPEALARPKHLDVARRQLSMATNLLPLGAVKATTGSFARFCARRISKRPASTMAGAAFAALLTAVALHALVFQHSRHGAAVAETKPALAAANVPPVRVITPAAPPPVVEVDPEPTTGSIPTQRRDQADGSAPHEAKNRGDGSEQSSRGHDNATARHGRSVAKTAKAKSADRISRYLTAGKPHKHKVSHDDE